MTAPTSPLDAVFHALSDPTRRAIVERVVPGPVSVSELARPFAMTLVAVLQHIKVLEASGLIHTTKEGRTRVCRIDAAALDAAERWFHDRRAIWEGRLDRLATVLDETE